MIFIKLKLSYELWSHKSEKKFFFWKDQDVGIEYIWLWEIAENKT